MLDIERIYASGTVEADDVGFERVLCAVQPPDDASLAEVIEADGRFRLGKGKAVDLERYLRGVPDLPGRRDPLDAALDVTLRGLSGSGRATPEAVHSLVSRYPALEEAIREAAALNAAVWSTTGLRQRVQQSPPRDLPCDFGPMLLTGARRYQLLELLGQGSFGQVYRAIDRQLSDKGHAAMVAIKVLSQGGAVRSPFDRQRLIEEATKVRRISHPNVVQALDRGISEDNDDFIVYEYVDGGDLSDLARDHLPLPPRKAAALLAKIARGVHAAHSAGVIHCDLKPSNIMLTASAEPKVADFGIAVRLEDRQAMSTAGSAGRGPVGNIAFISPEQFRGEDAALSVQSDVYALGGIFYYLLTAVLPNGASGAEIAANHRAASERAAPSPRAARPTIDRTLDAICRRALAVEPEGRHSSAAALAEDLERWLGREPIAWMRPSLAHRLGLWARRKPALAAATVVILVLALAGAGVAGHFASLANQRKIDVALAEAKVQHEEAIKAARAQYGQAVSNAIRKAGAQGEFVNEVLLTAWVLEYIFGPEVLSTPDRVELVWSSRIDALRQMLAVRRGAGQAESIDALLWEQLLAFWLVRQGDHSEAIDLIEHNIAAWRALEADTSWMSDLQALRDCAEVNRLLSEPSSGESERNADLAQSLELATERLAIERPRSPLHYLVLERLADLHEPALLNQPQRASDLRALVKTLLNSSHGRQAGLADEKRRVDESIARPPAGNR